MTGCYPARLIASALSLPPTSLPSACLQSVERFTCGYAGALVYRGVERELVSTVLENADEALARLRNNHCGVSEIQLR